ncbi:MAG: DUF302 domain-containing protein [Rhizobiaceae bacterium]
MKLRTILVLIATLWLPQAVATEVTEYVTDEPFATVRQDLRDAVINRGYVIDYEAFIGDMLKRTMGDVGGKKQIYKDAEFIQFCSAVLSRAAMAADPANISTCPYILFAYERTDEAGKVRVGFRKIDETGSDESRKALAKVNAVLDEIAREASGQ